MGPSVLQRGNWRCHHACPLYSMRKVLSLVTLPISCAPTPYCLAVFRTAASFSGETETTTRAPRSPNSAYSAATSSGTATLAPSPSPAKQDSASVTATPPSLTSCADCSVPSRRQGHHTINHPFFRAKFNRRWLSGHNSTNCLRIFRRGKLPPFAGPRLAPAAPLWKNWIRREAQSRRLRSGTPPSKLSTHLPRIPKIPITGVG